MYIDQFTEISISGQFDDAFKLKSPDHEVITWKLLKSLAFNLSELEPYGEGGLFKINNRLFIEYDGIDLYDPADNIETMVRILLDWWSRLHQIDEKERILFILLAYKYNIFNIEVLPKLSNNFDDLSDYISVDKLLEAKKIFDIREIM